MGDMELASAVWLTLQQNRGDIHRRRVRMRRLMALCSQMERSKIYATPNTHVPVVQIYLDLSKDMRFDYRLSSPSIEALMALLRREKTHGWEKYMEVLLVVYWLAYGLSYIVVSRVFDVPKTTVFDIVHRMCDAILSLLDKVVHFPTLAQCAEVGHGFQHLANSPAFSHCVGAIDGCHVRIKAPHGPHAQDYLTRKLFHSVQLQAICDSTGKFLDIFVGYPGSVHDTRVLRNSPVFVWGCYPPAGYFILGDGGYPCLTAPVNLITPYREPVKGRMEARFNAHHARALIHYREGLWHDEGTDSSEKGAPDIYCYWPSCKRWEEGACAVQ